MKVESAPKTPKAKINYYYTRQIKQLCKKYGITWTILTEKRKGMEERPLWCSSTATSSTNPSENIIEVPLCEGPNAWQVFLTALHEIGHCVEFSKLSDDEQYIDIVKTIESQNYRKVSKYLLAKEFAAWTYAQHFLGSKWTPRFSFMRFQILQEWITNYNKFRKRKLSYEKFSRDFSKVLASVHKTPIPEIYNHNSPQKTPC